MRDIKEDTKSLDYGSYVRNAVNVGRGGARVGAVWTLSFTLGLRSTVGAFLLGMYGFRV